MRGTTDHRDSPARITGLSWPLIANRQSGVTVKLWNVVGVAAVAAAAFLLPAAAEAVKTKPKAGSPNNAGTQERLVQQVLGFLGDAGISAQRVNGDGPQISLGTDDEQVANGAHAVAERVLLSTGYRPNVVKVGGEYKISVAKGPTAPGSADPALRM